MGAGNGDSAWSRHPVQQDWIGRQLFGRRRDLKDRGISNLNKSRHRQVLRLMNLCAGYKDGNRMADKMVEANIVNRLGGL